MAHHLQFGQRSTKLFSCGGGTDEDGGGTSSSLEVYDLPPSCPTFRRRNRFESVAPSSVALLAIDEAGSTAAIVEESGGDSHMKRRALILFDIRKGIPITTVIFEGPILAVRITTQRLAVILAARTHLFQLPSLTPLPQIASNPPNTRGLGALSTPAPNRSSYFGWPHRTHTSTTSDEASSEEDAVTGRRSRTIGGGGEDDGDDNKAAAGSRSNGGGGSGTLVLLDTTSSLLSLIAAYTDDVITCIEFSPSAEAVAVCATSGTLIKVFAVPSGDTLFTLRRGTTSATITGLTWSPSSTILLAASGNGTLHLFKCSPENSGKTTKSTARLAIPQNVRLQCAMSADDSHMLMVVDHSPSLSSTEGGGGGGQQQHVVEVYAVGSKDLTKTNEFAIR